MRQIIGEMRRLLDERDGGALVTITRTTGSTYRREGAKMLCLKNGAMIGSISGGCLEEDVYEISLEVVAENRPRIVSYDTSAENENVWGLGLGCNGTVEVLIEPMQWWRTSMGRKVFDEMTQRVEIGESCALVTILGKDGAELSGLSRILVDVRRNVVGDLGSPGLDSEVAQRAVAVLKGDQVRPSRKMSVDQDGSKFDVFIDALIPPIHLLVVGAGHDAIPVVKLASQLGMVISVVDSRPKFATLDRFPEAAEVICAQPEEITERVSLEGKWAAVLMNHHYLRDRAVLGKLLTAPSTLSYIGVLGPRARTEQMINELRSEGLALLPSMVDVIRTPVGLDIGADSPGEIALALLAELLAVRNRRSGLPLRDKKREKKAVVQSAA